MLITKCLVPPILVIYQTTDKPKLFVIGPRLGHSQETDCDDKIFSVTVFCSLPSSPSTN